MKLRTLLFIVVSLLYCGTALFFTRDLCQHSILYQQNMVRAAEILNFENRLLNPSEWVGNGPENAGLYEQLIGDAATCSEETFRFSLYFVALTIMYGTIVFFIVLRTSAPFLFLAIGTIIVAFQCLVPGLFSPMLEISAFKDNVTVPIQFEVPYLGSVIDFSKTFEGRTYFYYQSKSVVALIFLLFEKKNYVVAVSILLFSLVIPVLKLLVSCLLLFFREKDSVVAKIVLNSGKWSMADVFVAACFLSFLSFNNLQTGMIAAQSNTLVGLYFFLAYVILSILSTFLIFHAVRE